MWGPGRLEGKGGVFHFRADQVAGSYLSDVRQAGRQRPEQEQDSFKPQSAKDHQAGRGAYDGQCPAGRTKGRASWSKESSCVKAPVKDSGPQFSETRFFTSIVNQNSLGLKCY